MLVFFCLLLIALGLVLGFREDLKLVRVGKSMVCFAFLLCNLYFFYAQANWQQNWWSISVVWKLFPFMISLGILAICLLIIWKPFSDNKRQARALGLAGATSVLLVIVALFGAYGELLFGDSAIFVVWSEHLILALLAFVVFLCFSNKQVAARIGLSVLCVVPLFFVWVLVPFLIFELLDLFSGDHWEPYKPLWDWLVGIICIGTFCICLLFIWKPFGANARRITALCLAGAVVLSCVGIVSFKIYDESLTLSSLAGEVESYGRDISLIEYEPFRENTLAMSLDEPSALRLEENLPRLDGATALYPLYSAFARATYPEADYGVYYWDVYKNIDAIISCSMTSGAFERLIEGKVDLIFLMGVSEQQREMAREHGLELRLTPIGREAFVFFVNKRNSASNLTVQEVRGIYAGRITNWREVGGKNDAIKPYQRAANSGSQTMLLEIMGDTPLMTPPQTDYYDLMIGMYQAVADYKNYKNSLGYSFLFYINEMIAEDKIKFLSIDGVLPTAANITSGAYPFANDFYAITVVRKPESEMEAQRMNNTERLIAWILSPQGQSLVEKTGYAPLQP